MHVEELLRDASRVLAQSKAAYKGSSHPHRCRIADFRLAFFEPEYYLCPTTTNGSPKTAMKSAHRIPAVNLAIPRIRAFFDASPKRLFYSTQTETALERDLFHWITGKALLELGNAKSIQRVAFRHTVKSSTFTRTASTDTFSESSKQCSSCSAGYSILNSRMPSGGTGN